MLFLHEKSKSKHQRRRLYIFQYSLKHGKSLACNVAVNEIFENRKFHFCFYGAFKNIWRVGFWNTIDQNWAFGPELSAPNCLTQIDIFGPNAQILEIFRSDQILHSYRLNLRLFASKMSFQNNQPMFYMRLHALVGIGFRWCTPSYAVCYPVENI